jgi:hypothetical protein
MRASEPPRPNGTTVNKDTPVGDRGNVTSIRRYSGSATVALCSSSGTGYVEEHFHYDDVGNVVEYLDPLGHSTTFSYADRFDDNTNHHTYAFPTDVANAAGHHVTRHMITTRASRSARRTRGVCPLLFPMI